MNPKDGTDMFSSWREAQEQLFGQWKGLLGEISALREEFKTAAPYRQKEIEEQYNKLLQKGMPMQRDLIATAEKAYAENPKGDKEIESLLASNVKRLAQADDYEEAFRVQRLIRDAHEKGMSIIIVEHKLKILMKLVEKVIVLHQGRLIGEGSPKEIANNDRVISAYLGTEAKEYD